MCFLKLLSLLQQYLNETAKITLYEMPLLEVYSKEKAETKFCKVRQCFKGEKNSKFKAMFSQKLTCRTNMYY